MCLPFYYEKAQPFIVQMHIYVRLSLKVATISRRKYHCLGIIDWVGIHSADPFVSLKPVTVWEGWYTPYDPLAMLP